MQSPLLRFICTTLVLFLASVANAAGRYLEVSYPPSTQPGELQLGVAYTLWIPDGVAQLRGIIVHQHGCGTGACKGGETAAYDLHWQALARKWDCALLGPSYQQEEKQNCRLWCDPRNGSAKTFLRAIEDSAAKSNHPELARVPWCLWGHSGGGFWASLMQTMYPDRIVAIWLRSGTAFATWEKGEIPRPEIPAVAHTIPVMCNPGAKENGDKRFSGAWNGTLAMFKAYRAHGAPIGFAPDPRTSHQCGDCRYLAIPFFDACLAMRLPGKGSVDQKLKPVNMTAAWLAAPLSGQTRTHRFVHREGRRSGLAPQRKGRQGVGRVLEDRGRIGYHAAAAPSPSTSGLPENPIRPSKLPGRPRPISRVASRRS